MKMDNDPRPAGYHFCNNNKEEDRNDDDEKNIINFISLLMFEIIKAMNELPVSFTITVKLI